MSTQSKFHRCINPPCSLSGTAGQGDTARFMGYINGQSISATPAAIAFTGGNVAATDASVYSTGVGVDSAGVKPLRTGLYFCSFAVGSSSNEVQAIGISLDLVTGGDPVTDPEMWAYSLQPGTTGGSSSVSTVIPLGQTLVNGAGTGIIRFIADGPGATEAEVTALIVRIGDFHGI